MVTRGIHTHITSSIYNTTKSWFINLLRDRLAVCVRGLAEEIYYFYVRIKFAQSNHFVVNANVRCTTVVYKSIPFLTANSRQKSFIVERQISATFSIAANVRFKTTAASFCCSQIVLAAWTCYVYVIVNRLGYNLVTAQLKPLGNKKRKPF